MHLISAVLINNDVTIVAIMPCPTVRGSEYKPVISLDRHFCLIVWPGKCNDL